MGQQNRHHALGRIFALTYPLFLGYVSVGFIFGVVAVSAGFSPLFAVLTSVFLYAGAAQFLLVNLLKLAVPLSEVFIAVFFLNLRHIFYFKPVEKKFPGRGIKHWYAVVALTDESFAVLTDAEVKKTDSFGIILMSHSYWILGTALGAGLGKWVSHQWKGLDFALIALFLVLLIEKLKWRQDKALLLLCAFTCVVCWALLPSKPFLLVTMGITLLFAARKGRTHA